LSDTSYGSIDLASAYEELSDPQFAHGMELIALLEIRPDDRVLDIGCGTGRLAAFAVEHLGAGGRLVGIDPAPPRVQLAQQRRDPRLEFRIGRAEDLASFPNASFAVAYMNSVLNWIDDRPKALLEAYRILQPGGRLGIATTVRDRPNQLRLLERRAWRTVRAGGVSEEPRADQAGAKQAATAQEIRAMLEEAGFAPKLVDVRTFTSTFRDVAQIMNFSQATAYGQLVPGATADDYAAFLEAIETLLGGEFAGCVTDEGIRLERYVLLAVAEKPR
jgi:ubiquinone/menaquinone biosynthesis C-methylase UbiE